MKNHSLYSVYSNYEKPLLLTEQERKPYPEEQKFHP